MQVNARDFSCCAGWDYMVPCTCKVATVHVVSMRTQCSHYFRKTGSPSQILLAFQKCNPPDFQFYPSKLINKNFPHNYYGKFSLLFIPRHTKSGGVLCYTLQKFWNFECLSVHASFPDSNLSSFWPVFFGICMDIDIGEEWFGIANGLNLFINKRVMALIDVYTMYVVSGP